MSAGDGARRRRDWEVRALEGLLNAAVKFEQETPSDAFHLVPKATMRHGTQAPEKLRGELD